MPSLANQILECFVEGEPLARRDLPLLSCYDSMGRSLGQLVRDGRLLRVYRGCFRLATADDKPASSVPLNKVIARFIDRSTHNVFIRSDFAGLGDDSGVGRVLHAMVESGCLLRLGRGLYTPATQLPEDDTARPIKPVSELIVEAARRLKLTIVDSSYDDSGTGRAKRRRIKRRIGYGENFAFLGD